MCHFYFQLDGYFCSPPTNSSGIWLAHFSAAVPTSSYSYLMDILLFTFQFGLPVMLLALWVVPSWIRHSITWQLFYSVHVLLHCNGNGNFDIFVNLIDLIFVCYFAECHCLCYQGIRERIIIWLSDRQTTLYQVYFDIRGALLGPSQNATTNIVQH